MNAIVANAAPASAGVTFADSTVAGSSRTVRSALLVAAALVIALLATLVHPGVASARTVVPARTSTEISIARATQRLLNTERAANHLAPLKMKIDLLSSARSHNLAMAAADTMSHQLAGEPDLARRLDRAGYKWSWAGENIGWNSQMDVTGVLALEKMMYNEVAPNDGHRLNILNSHFTHVGIDVYFDTVHQKVWLTVDFGRP